MPNKLSPSDRRALALINRFGRAVAMPTGFWLTGSAWFGWFTGNQIIGAGLAYRAREDGRDVLYLTDAGREAVSPDDLTPADAALPVPDDVPSYETDPDDSWDPPDYRDARDDPVAVDVAMKRSG